MMPYSFSYWENQTYLSAYDVLIIGGGIVGLNAALQLKTRQPKLKIGVLEKGFLPSGASTKNAGFACFGSVSELISEIKLYGEETVFNLVAKRIEGLRTLRDNLGDKAICFEKNGGYELFLHQDEKQKELAFSNLSSLNNLLKPLTHYTDIFTECNDKITAFGFNGVKALIYNAFEGQIDTGKMMKALTQKVQSLGVNILNNCDVLTFEKENTIILKTNQGIFTASHLVFATNAFTSRLLPEINIKPARGQVLVTEPIKNLKLKGTFHYDEGYYYFRNIDGRILLGGGRNLDFKAEETSDLHITKPIQDKLEELLKEVILPNQKIEIDFQWSGIMGFGEELAPIIKKISANIYVAARCNGMGIAIGSLTGMEVAELVLADL